MFYQFLIISSKYLNNIKDKVVAEVYCSKQYFRL